MPISIMGVYSAAVWRLHLLIARDLIKGQTLEAITKHQPFEGLDRRLQ